MQAFFVKLLRLLAESSRMPLSSSIHQKIWIKLSSRLRDSLRHRRRHLLRIADRIRTGDRLRLLLRVARRSRLLALGTRRLGVLHRVHVALRVSGHAGRFALGAGRRSVVKRRVRCGRVDGGVLVLKGAKLRLRQIR